MTLKFAKRTMFIAMFAVLATLCMALAIYFLFPTSQTASADDDHDASHTDWTELTESSDSVELSSGSYYLSGTLSANITITGDVTLCLNGYTLNAFVKSDSSDNTDSSDSSDNTDNSEASDDATSEDSNEDSEISVLSDISNGGQSVITVSAGATFTLCDCQGSGTVTGTNSGTDSYSCGVYVAYGATFTMDGGTITGNTAGCGVVVGSGATFIMNGGTITGNTADYGGGVYVAYGATFTMSGGSITGNTANYGGGVYVADGATFTLSGGTITNNNASNSSSDTVGNGGGVYVNSGTFTMSGGTVSGNTASNTSSDTVGNGGGVYVNSGTFTMSGGTISDNTASSGNGVYTIDNGEFSLVGGYLNDTVGNSNGTISISGGYLSSSAYSSLSEYITSGYSFVSTSDSTYPYVVSRNHAAHDDGTTFENLVIKLGGTLSAGSYYLGYDVTAESTITISSGTVYLCLNGYTLTGSGSGSVITVSNDATLILCDCSEEGTGTITGGNAYDGGGVYVGSGSTLIMNGGTITGNTASRHGGGVYVTGSGTFIMNGGTITGNTAGRDGGGVDFGSGTFIMNGGTITGNTAAHDGACIAIGSATFTMTGGTIDGLYIYKSTAEIEGGTIDGLIWNNRSTLNIKGGYYSCTYGTNYGTTSIYGGYFNETSYNKFAKSNLSSDVTTIDLTEFYAAYGSMPDSNYSADYPYAVYGKGEYSISNVTVTYGESYSAKASGTYVEAYVIYAFGDNIDANPPTDAGIYSVTATIISITDSNVFNTGTVTFTVVILQKDLAEDMFSITGTYIYNGTEQRAEYTYADTDKDNAVLTADDFDVTYSYNTSAGTATVTFTGKGNYSGEVTLTYEIKKADYDTSGLSLTNKTVTYNGSAQTLTVSGTLPAGVTVTYYYEGTNGTTYERTTTAPTNAGCYTVTAVFSGDENYNSISSLTADLTIEKASYDTSSLTLEDVTVTYDGEAQAVTVSGLPDGVTATVYYTGAYSTVYEKTTVAPTEAGIYFVTIVFSGDFDNYNSISNLTSILTIEKAAVSEETVQTLNITAKVGDSLEDIELPEGWEWSDTATFSSSGDYVVYATYSADDNYETVTTAVTVSVKGYSSSDKLSIAAIVIGCAVFAVGASILTLFFLKKKKI